MTPTPRRNTPSIQTPIPAQIITFFVTVTLLLLTTLTPLNTLANTLTNTLNNQSNSLLNTLKGSGYSQPAFLSLEEAFQGNIERIENELVINWIVADQYYLYRDRFGFELAESTKEANITIGEPRFSHSGIMKEDELFGNVEVYYHHVTITLPFETPAEQTVDVVVKYQGCADAGLCYPPSKLIQTVTLPAKTVALPTMPAQTAAIPPPPSLDKGSANSIAAYLKTASTLPILGLFFLLGVGLTFTPCVLPMIPILSSIIVGQKSQLTPVKGFLLSSSYVLGMALAFAVAGLLVGLSGARVQIYLQNPMILSLFAGLFVLLALSMFGFYELQLPAPLRHRLDTLNSKQQGGHFIGVFVMGILSALVVSPCVSAPLAGALIYIASEGSPYLGGAALFILGLGMGAPLVIIGTTGANILPKAGSWMNAVKAVFGVLLLFVAAWLLRTVLPGPIMMLIWAALLIIPALFMGALDPLEPSASGWHRFWKGVAIIMVIYGVALIWGGAQGITNPLKPLQPVAFAATGSPNTLNARSTTYTNSNQMAGTLSAMPRLHFETVTNNDELSSAIATAVLNQRPSMIDFYADWCIACVEMEHNAFADLRSIEKLKPFKLIKVDITEGGDESTQLLDRYDLIGPPSILFLDKNGERIHTADIMGEMSADRFISHLDQAVIPNVIAKNR